MRNVVPNHKMNVPLITYSLIEMDRIKHLLKKKKSKEYANVYYLKKNGYTNRQIGDCLHISSAKVRNILANIKKGYISD